MQHPLKTPTTMHDPLDRITAFLVSLGIDIQEEPVPQSSFLPGVRIHHGGLQVDRSRLVSPGDVLHEAGHIAITPAALRPGLAGALPAEAMAPHAGEPEAIAWSWAALVHLGLPAEMLFHEAGYKGRAASLRMAYGMGVWPGAFGLAQAGMTDVGRAADGDDTIRYPRMRRWLRG
jgi:hypothetical protein